MEGLNSAARDVMELAGGVRELTDRIRELTATVRELDGRLAAIQVSVTDVRQEMREGFRRFHERAAEIKGLIVDLGDGRNGAAERGR
jgi:hypothetical protein